MHRPCPQESRPSGSGGKRSSNAILKIDFTTQKKTAPLGGVSCNIRLQHVSDVIHLHWKLIKLRDTNVQRMLLSVSCNHSWRTLSWRKNASKEISKILQQLEVFLCAVHYSPLKKSIKKRIFFFFCTFPERGRRDSFTKPDDDLS